MYDARHFARRGQKSSKEQQSGPARRAAILLTDGDDNMSHVNVSKPSTWRYART